MNIEDRVQQFKDMLSELSGYHKLDSQFMISLVEDFTITVDELPDDGCDHTDQLTRDTWGSIHGQCRGLLDAFEPKSKKDKDALLMMMAGSQSICIRMETNFKKWLKKNKESV